MRDWEDRESHSLDESPFDVSALRSKDPATLFERSNIRNMDAFESTFLSKTEMEAEQPELETATESFDTDNVTTASPRKACDCGGGSFAAPCLREAPSYLPEAASYESLLAEVFPGEAISTEALSPETVSMETLTYTGSTTASETEGLEEAEWETSHCTAGCPEPTAAERSRIRAKGSPEGAFMERTEGDPTSNLALQLYDYDVNEYRILKGQHREALTRIREFVVNRLAQTDQPIAVTITGLASRTGAKAYNDVLSCKRAECAAENLRTSLSFFRGASARVQINTLGDGFTHATCKGSDCELGEWRSVLVSVHAPGRPPKPVPPVDPGWDKYEIRCRSFHTTAFAEALLQELLERGLPGVPPGLRHRLIKPIKKGIDRLGKELLKLPKLAAAAEGASELLKFLPAEGIKETGVFEIREREKANGRATVLNYSGYGLRIVLPRGAQDEFLDKAIGKVAIFRSLSEAARKDIREAIKKAISWVTVPIGSDTPGPFARFDVLHPRNVCVFSCDVQVGKGIWMPGQVNVEFNSPPWTRPDPIRRPHIIRCPDTACNDAGVQTIVGDGMGLELFSITVGDLIAGSCACASGVQREAEAEMELQPTPETEVELEAGFGELDEAEIWNSSATEAQEKLWEAESQEIEAAEPIYSVNAPKAGDFSPHEIVSSLGSRPAALALHQMLNSSEMQQAALALHGHSGQRSVRFNGLNITVPVYLRLVSRLSREVAEQIEAEVNETSAYRQPSGALKYPADSRHTYFAIFQAAIQGVAGKPRLTARQKANLAERIADAAMSRLKTHGDQINGAMNTVSSENDRKGLNVALNPSGLWSNFFKSALSATAGGVYDHNSPEKPVNEAAEIASEAMRVAGHLDW